MTQCILKIVLPTPLHSIKDVGRRCFYYMQHLHVSIHTWSSVLTATRLNMKRYTFQVYPRYIWYASMCLIVGGGFNKIYMYIHVCAVLRSCSQLHPRSPPHLCMLYTCTQLYLVRYVLCCFSLLPGGSCKSLQSTVHLEVPVLLHHLSSVLLTAPGIPTTKILFLLSISSWRMYTFSNKISVHL